MTDANGDQKMDDRTVKKHRESHVKFIDLLGQAEGLHSRIETQLMARPNSLVTRGAMWWARLSLRMCQFGEERARAKARKTY